MDSPADRVSLAVPARAPRRSALRGTLAALPIVWALAGAAYLVLDPLTGAALPPVVVVGHFQVFLLLGAAPFAIWAWRQRQRMLAAVLTLLVAAGLYVNRVELFGSAPELRGAPPPDLVVTTWNAGHGRATPDEVVAQLRADPGDVIVVQEWTEEARAAIDAQLGERFPARHYFGHGKASLALFSEWPTSAVQVFEPVGAKLWLAATVTTPRGNVRIVGLHLDLWGTFFGDWARSDEVLAGVIEHLGDDPRALVAGDFNLTPAARALDVLGAAGYADAYRAAGSGFGFTFPTFGGYRGVPSPPVVRIDQIWLRPGLRARRACVGSDGGSDHLPLHVELELR